MFAGGIADKLGNRYEAKWLVRQLLDVIGAKAEALRFEGISQDFKGFEFVVRRDGVTEWHQTKINSPNGNWTLPALAREGVLAAFKARLKDNQNNVCHFVSQDPAKDAARLSEKARLAENYSEFRSTLGKGSKESFNTLLESWSTSKEPVAPEVVFSWLRRSYFGVESQTSIEAALATFSDFYFHGTDGSSFAILREFLENRFNKEITTELARIDLRAEAKLKLKDWSLDPTTKERLASETTAYLETYTPFGADGSRVSRSESQRLIDLVTAADGPKIILLTGVAGSGKSGVIRGLVESLADRDIPHLAFRIDQHLECTSRQSLGKAVTGREESPAATLKGVAPDQPAVLIVDQVDAVNEVSGRNGAVKQAVLRLVNDVRNFGGITIVIACRTFDLESDPRLKDLKSTAGVEHVEVKLLSWDEEVKPLLESRTIKTASFSENQRELLRLPLNLAIFLDVYDGESTTFGSRNDLFERLLEKKGRSIRDSRQTAWEVTAPLTRLSEWMSEQQRLDAPQSILSEFSGALDLLSSEGLIARSRSQVSFFHESLFDYIYARSFAAREKTLVDLLGETEQHLFRRTQVRQVLETLRQTDRNRYISELRTVLLSGAVRYHIKVAIAQWLGSLNYPTSNEKDILLSIDDGVGNFSPLLRHAFFSSPGWFDLLHRDGWIGTNLESANDKRKDAVFWWLTNIAGHRPTEVAELLENWWKEDPAKGRELLNWFGFVKRKVSDSALMDLCCRIMRSLPKELFDLNNRDLLLHTWAGEGQSRASEILAAYFDAWFDAHPGQHPFERDEFRGLDRHSLDDMGKNAPEALVAGSIQALVRSVRLINERKSNNQYDSAFRIRPRSGHHFGSDAFLEVFRASMRQVASTNPITAEQFLRQLSPSEHEVFTHIWLETITANAEALAHSMEGLLESPHLFDAGWRGAEWKSFADAAKETIPFLSQTNSEHLFQLIAEHQPELRHASDIMARIRAQGEEGPWENRRTALHYINRSGYKQLCILETIGASLLNTRLTARVRELRRKFPKASIPQPHHMEARSVPSPIKRDRAALMTDEQWLRAIEQYDGNEDRRRERDWLSGGASQLASELQHFVKQEPSRFVELLESIPNSAHPTYISHVLWGLAETEELAADLAGRAIFNAHNRPNRPFGSDIARIFDRHPDIIANPNMFDTLAWYVINGGANDDEAVDASQTERELATIEDLLDRGGLHIRGINGTRGWAAEATGNALWGAPSAIKQQAWGLLEQRIENEHLTSVRCCLMRPLVPLFNEDRERCANLVDRLSRHPTTGVSSARTSLEMIWRSLAFPPVNAPTALKSVSVWGAGIIERIARQVSPASDGDEQLAPLLTHQGVYLFQFLLNGVPEVGERLLYRLIVTGGEQSRMIGAWHIFRKSFHDARYAPMADALSSGGVVYRRLSAGVASHAIALDEYRYRAENILEKSFNDEDEQVRNQAGEVFRELAPNEFGRHLELAYSFLRSKAFEAESWSFFHILEKAECKVDDIVISATEALIEDLESNGNAAGRRSMTLHQLQDILKKEYAASEANPTQRGRLLDQIDRMLELELYGVDSIIRPHER